MFERYSNKARRVIFFARYEASQFGSPVLDTEHLLLGILRESRDLLLSVASPAMVETIRERVLQYVPIHDKIPTSVDLPFSDSAEAALHAATEEADRLASHRICTQHILLGLLHEENCLAHRILSEMGVRLEAARIIAAGWAEEGTGLPGLNLPGVVTGKAVPSEEFQKVVSDAIEEAGLLHSTSAKPEHILLALLRTEGSTAGKILREAGLDHDGVRRKLGAG